ncbi:hypothetical protein DOY81_000381, partial [Sarcophaga bullata]
SNFFFFWYCCCYYSVRVCMTQRYLTYNNSNTIITITEHTH